MVKFGIVVFPGSNCDHDAYHAAKHVFGQEARFIWHKESTLGDVDVVLLPGGFSYGDYLRSGAIARFSPVMRAVVDFANGGGLVVGVCNGFQVLCESGLLPGALMRNSGQRFRCKEQYLRVENNQSIFTNQMQKGQVVNIPIAHGDGNYFADAETLAQLEAQNQIVFRYCNEDGESTPEANPNGSIQHIAGIINEKGNVLGMMPHPERHVDALLGSTDGGLIFASILESFVGA
jgi:phosphoribosylformylglycinamidine synthase